MNDRHGSDIGRVSFVGRREPAQGADPDECSERPRDAFLAGAVVAQETTEIQSFDPLGDQPVRPLLVGDEIEHLLLPLGESHTISIIGEEKGKVKRDFASSVQGDPAPPDSPPIRAPKPPEAMQ